MQANAVMARHVADSINFFQPVAAFPRVLVRAPHVVGALRHVRGARALRGAGLPSQRACSSEHLLCTRLCRSRRPTALRRSSAGRNEGHRSAGAHQR